MIILIPARIGSKRLKEKNLAPFLERPIIDHAIYKAKQITDADNIFVSSDSRRILTRAEEFGVMAIERAAALADDNATSEDYIADAFQKTGAEKIVQLHTIAPLLKVSTINSFIDRFKRGVADVLLSGIEDRIEVMIDGRPVNFDFNKKTNSQLLTPTQRITWPLTGWRREAFMEGRERHGCGTYYGKCDFFAVGELEAKVIKTAEDLQLCEAMAKSYTGDVWNGY